MRKSAQTGVPDRTTVLAATAETMARSGRRWAWQGPLDAPDRWLQETGPKDLDLWYDSDGPDTSPDTGPDVDPDASTGPDAPVDALRQVLSCASVADSRHPGRPRHVSLAVETPDGAAVVDLTCGDLRVGPVLLVPAGEIDVDPAEHRFTGACAVADLLVRPILRGRWPEPARLAQARAAWAATGEADRHRLFDRLAAQLGHHVAGRLAATLNGARPDPGLPRRARARLVALSLAPAHVMATWAQRRTVLPAGSAAGPLGLRVRGVVVAVVGTDGAGKSTVVDALTERLHRYGLRTGSAYFGMARGNLPGVTLARRLLGVPGTTGAPDDQEPSRPPAAHHPYLRRAAAWFYAGEYVWRYLRVVAPQRSRRRVVIVDRWVYDLRESPWPGSQAARVAQFLVPDPDVLVLPDAPIELIHARKPERRFADQAQQQERYRRLLDERVARWAEVVVDTSGDTPDPLRELVAVVVEAVHGVRGRPRRR